MSPRRSKSPTRLLRFPFDSEQGELIVEVEAPQEAKGPRMRSSGGELIEDATETFEQVLHSSLRPLSQALVSTFEGLATPPQKIKVEFGLNFSAKAGVVLSSVASSASIDVTLTWGKKKDEDE